MTQDLIRAALVIPVYNRRQTTLQCLRSLAKIVRDDIDARIFVVDDGSTDGTSDAIASEFPMVEIIRGDGSLHYAAGTNRGIEAALNWNADYIVTMNDDAVYHDQFLQRLIQTAQNNKRSVVGALLLLWDNPHLAFQVAPVWKTLQGGWTFPDEITAFNAGSTPISVEMIVGNCVLFPVAAIKECGLMDEENFPHGWGDAQYLVRMKKAGWNLLVDPRVFVWCEPNTYPTPMHKLGLRKVIDVLFRDRKNPQNLHRQWIARRESAPSKLQAFIAFVIYVLQLVMKFARFAFSKI